MHWLLHFFETNLALQNDNEKTVLSGHLFPCSFFQHIEKNTLYLFPVETAVEEFHFNRGQHRLVVLDCVD